MGRVWFITRGQRCLGRSMVTELVARGERVVVGLPDAAAVDELERAHPGQARAVLLPFGDAAAVTRGAEQALAAFGTLDVLVHPAVRAAQTPFDDDYDAEARRLFDINVFGPLAVARALAPTLRRTRGQLALLSTVNGFVGRAGQSLTCASQFALEGLGESLARELGPDGVRVTIVECEVREYDRAARAIIDALQAPEPPLRLALGRDALSWMRGKLDAVAEELAQWEPVTLRSSDGDVAARAAGSLE